MIVGAHVSSSGGIEKSVERALDLGCNALQLFTQSPRMWRPTAHKPANVAAFRAARESQGIEAAVAHAIYLINLASDDPDLWRTSVDALVATMQAADALGLDGVVLHPGSRKQAGFDEAAERVARGVAEALAASESTWLLLENAAGHAGAMGRDTGELATLFDACGAPDRLGICLDSCHWFASGIDVRETKAITAELKVLDAGVGLDRLRCLHLNDSKTPFGSNRDRHANIGEGEIGPEGLSTFLRHPKLRGLPVILETAGDGDGPTAREVALTRELGPPAKGTSRPKAAPKPKAVPAKPKRAAARPRPER